MSVSNEIYESHTQALSEQVQALKAEVERLLKRVAELEAQRGTL